MNKLFRYFSQYGEDFLLWSFFDFKPRGFFIDVGAFDGVHLSNSYSFELMGWNGICVEPHPFYYKLCKTNRPKSICINKACGKTEQENVVFHVDNTGLFSSFQEIGDDENIVSHFDLLKDVDVQIESIQVEGTTLNSIAQQYPPDQPIDFISIDVEGVELDVLQGFDIAGQKPRVLVVETNNETTQREINSYLQELGYLFSRKTTANSFYVTNEDDNEKLKSIELNCLIEKQIHPLGDSYTIPSYLNGLFLYNGESIDVFRITEQLEQQTKLAQTYKEKINGYLEQIKEYQQKVKRFDQWLKEHKDKILEKHLVIKQLKGDLDSANDEIRSLKEDVGIQNATIIKLRQELSKTLYMRLRGFLRKLRNDR